MSKRQSTLDFRLMALAFRLRDMFSPRMDILREAGIDPGSHVLDYGCGPGSYIVPLAELVGPSGKIYALDIHPLAVQMVQRLASNKQLSNVETIHSDCDTGLPEDSIDVVLLYDILHDLSNSDSILRELRRVLKPSGVLSVHDPHMGEGDLVPSVTEGGLFRLSRQGEKTLSFAPVS
jgi:ubiquinone/menaquinone biosynthesis C-methylase UbiE